MKTFITIITATIMGIASAHAVVRVTCLEDLTSTLQIDNGKKTTMLAAYVSPNCSSDPACACSLCAKSGYCTCDDGYYAKVTYGTDNCFSDCDCSGVCPSNSTCTSATSFTCNKGHFKFGSTCAPCPPTGYGVGATTASTGATSMSECYIPAGTTSSDTTGTFQFTEKCYY